MDPRSIKRILVPTDFSEPSAAAIDMAVDFAKAFGATIELVHVAGEAVYTLPPPIDVATVPIDMTALVDRARASLDADEARIRAAGVSCESTLLGGRADTEIVAQAEKSGADLIVMGTHGRSWLPHVLLGSVAEKVVQHAPRPVLIVPTRRR
jgi:nucleotide-binding universal stress UspA family protein